MDFAGVLAEARGARMPEARSLDFDQTLARTGYGAFVIGADGRILVWNRAAEKTMGHTARETIGRPCCEMFVGLDGDGNRLCYQGCHLMNLVRLSEPIQSFHADTSLPHRGAKFPSRTIRRRRKAELARTSGVPSPSCAPGQRHSANLEMSAMPSGAQFDDLPIGQYISSRCREQGRKRGRRKSQRDETAGRLARPRSCRRCAYSKLCSPAR
jgi:PAS domain-containing protein